eukprot:jgi/Tetstr1/463371/TSEL_008293.t1
MSFLSTLTGAMWMGDILDWMMNNKVPDETCQTYVAADMECKPYNVCHNCEPEHGTCFPIYSGAYTGYGISEWGRVTGEDDMMAEIYARGPVVCSIAAISDFDDNYPAVVGKHEGIFITTTSLTEDDVNHNVEILGWGETKSGVKYWIGRNSWGTYWGEGGFFRIGRVAAVTRTCALRRIANGWCHPGRILIACWMATSQVTITMGYCQPRDGEKFSNRPVPSQRRPALEAA